MRFLWRAVRVLLVVLGILTVVVLGAAGGIFAALPTIAEHVPLVLSRVTMTDGARTVEMQGMVHLAEPRFYRDVTDLVAERRRAGWLVFYEEVRPEPGDDAKAGTAEVMKRLGAEWSPESGEHPYVMLSSLLGDGLVLQDNRALLGPPGPDERNVDITLSDLLSALPPADADDPMVDLAAARDEFATLPPWIQVRLRAAVRIGLSLAASGSWLHAGLPEGLTLKREAKVAQAIQDEAGRNILILYGQAHIPAIRDRLLQAGKGWSVVRTMGVRAM
ncbi:hypothetical protein M2352_002492 [Azospirillum fermentarium]|uniref:hypothetical protein n=1 Tax=Azospirillum fermentarium TaxID=1233114 RepID=UPI0022271D17|nr:hypothetical protein [Azospirillum fermentarium]MCW2246901.1 hypothetical protein [Azospirillum fermentarium]